MGWWWWWVHPGLLCKADDGPATPAPDPPPPAHPTHPPCTRRFGSWAPPWTLGIARPTRRYSGTAYTATSLALDCVLLWLLIVYRRKLGLEWRATWVVRLDLGVAGCLDCPRRVAGGAPHPPSLPPTAFCWPRAVLLMLSPLLPLLLPAVLLLVLALAHDWWLTVAHCGLLLQSGDPCRMPVNVIKCAFCPYHVQASCVLALRVCLGSSMLCFTCVMSAPPTPHPYHAHASCVLALHSGEGGGRVMQYHVGEGATVA